MLCFIDPRVRKIRNKASKCPGIFSKTLHFYYVATSPGSPLLHLLDGHRKLIGCSAIPARSCPGPVSLSLRKYYKVWLEVPPDETPGLTTIQPHNTNVLQSITYFKLPYPPDTSNPGQKLMLSTRVWLVLPDSITSQSVSLMDASSLLENLGPPSLGAVAEFGRSRHKRWWHLPSENYTCMYMTLNVKRHINFLIRHIIYWKSLNNI